MDSTMETVSRLYEHGASMREISRRGICSAAKARKILITTGQYSTPAIESVRSLRDRGMSVPRIAEQLDLSPSAVWSCLPYEKGIYNAEHPTKNAWKIRRTREKKRLTSGK